MPSVARQNVKLMFDTHHLLYRDEIPTDYVRTIQEYLVRIHVSDNDRVIPGEGRVDRVGADASAKRLRRVPKDLFE
jgi:protein FrlC